MCMCGDVQLSLFHVHLCLGFLIVTQIIHNNVTPYCLITFNCTLLVNTLLWRVLVEQQDDEQQQKKNKSDSHPFQTGPVCPLVACRGARVLFLSLRHWCITILNYHTVLAHLHYTPSLAVPRLCQCSLARLTEPPLYGIVYDIVTLPLHFQYQHMHIIQAKNTIAQERLPVYTCISEQMRPLGD